ncbi:hypothetical protein DTQ70_30215 (plasmid) [Runella sp. SP2]|nr:hypothetical protein DTQ70_30215 [Runella sp. SP2]
MVGKNVLIAQDTLPNLPVDSTKNQFVTPKNKIEASANNDKLIKMIQKLQDDLSVLTKEYRDDKKHLKEFDKIKKENEAWKINDKSYSDTLKKYQAYPNKVAELNKLHEEKIASLNKLNEEKVASLSKLNEEKALSLNRLNEDLNKSKQQQLTQQEEINQLRTEVNKQKNENQTLKAQITILKNDSTTKQTTISGLQQTFQKQIDENLALKSSKESLETIIFSAFDNELRTVLRNLNLENDNPLTPVRKKAESLLASGGLTKNEEMNKKIQLIKKNEAVIDSLLMVKRVLDEAYNKERVQQKIRSLEALPKEDLETRLLTEVNNYKEYLKGFCAVELRVSTNIYNLYTRLNMPDRPNALRYLASLYGEYAGLKTYPSLADNVFQIISSRNISEFISGKSMDSNRFKNEEASYERRKSITCINNN